MDYKYEIKTGLELEVSEMKSKLQELRDKKKKIDTFSDESMGILDMVMFLEGQIRRNEAILHLLDKENENDSLQTMADSNLLWLLDDKYKEIYK